MDVRVEKSFPIFRGDLRFTMDVFNIFNTGYVLSVDDDYYQDTFGQTEEFSSPREIRLGVRYKF